jgi:hypothetical protein
MRLTGLFPTHTLINGHRYEFKHRNGNFSIDIFQSNFYDLDGTVKGFVCNSFNPNPIGHLFELNSPLTIYHKEIYPEQGHWQ